MDPPCRSPALEHGVSDISRCSERLQHLVAWWESVDAEEKQPARSSLFRIRKDSSCMYVNATNTNRAVRIIEKRACLPNTERTAGASRKKSQVLHLSLRCCDGAGPIVPSSLHQHPTRPASRGSCSIATIYTPSSSPANQQRIGRSANALTFLPQPPPIASSAPQNQQRAPSYIKRQKPKCDPHAFPNPLTSSSLPPRYATSLSC